MGNDKRKQKQGPWHCVLQRKVSVDDVKWDYKVNFPQTAAGPQGDSKQEQSSDGEKVTIKFVKVSEKGITLSFEKQSINRILASERSQLDKFILISFQGFSLNGNKKETEDYVSRLLQTGISLNFKSFIFYGHSNSQLKSRTCYLYNAVDGTTIMRKISELGDFSKCQSIAKRAKRIGLLFSAAEASMNLDPRFIEDIPDVELNGHVYTDGCGNLSKSFANELQRKRKIIFHNQRYTPPPSAFQIRYKGYKGMLMMNPDLDKSNIKAQFRASMKKFSNCPDNNFAILDYCKPFTYAFLNGELVTLLSCLGISNDVFLKKQKEYFEFLEQAHVDPRVAYKYLCYKGEIDLAESVLLGESSEETQSKIRKLTREEWLGSFSRKDYKEDTERVRIMIPNSRILFGVCDYTGTLKPGECHVRITVEGSGVQTIVGAYVIVSRNPCLHPGDIQKFKAVHCDALNHMVDCIVFPIVGQRDPASLMSGGDLDGDKFFVSWDRDIIPSTISEAYGYPAAHQPTRRDIKYADMIKYFAGYNNSSLGRVKNLYLDWARASPEGARCKECQQLNALFSSCVDGERIRIPEHLDLDEISKRNKSEPVKSTFVADVLCDKVKELGLTIFKKELEAVESTPVELLEFILSSSTCCLLNEFELFKLTARWCQAHNRNMDDFVCYFNFGNFTSIQKHAVVSMLDTFYWRGMSDLYLGTIFNGLLYSHLLSERDLRKYRLHTPHIRWQKFYSSFYDEGNRLQAELQRGLESFEKKLLVFRVDEQLTVAVYIPRRLERFDDIEVDKQLQMFAFVPISDSSYHQSTVHGYRLLYDGEIIQIYEKRRPNTFIWFALNRDFRKRAGIQPQEHNYKTEFKVSIALQKFSQAYSQTRARVNKQECYGLELYVVSNRDREGHDMLDISMNNVATIEKLKTLENTPREYNIDLDGADWTYRQFCGEVIVNRRFELLGTLQDVCEFEQIFSSCVGVKQDDRLVQVVHHILTNITQYSARIRSEIIQLMLKYLDGIPALAILIVQALAGEYDEEVSENGRVTSAASWKVSMHPAFDNYDDYILLACSLLSCMNEMKESASKQFNKLPELMTRHGVSFRIPVCTLLIRQIIFSVRDSKLATDCIETIFNEEFPVLDAGGVGAESERNVQNHCIEYYKKFVQALAMDYLGQVENACPCDFWGVPIGAEEQGAPAGKTGPSYAKPTRNVNLSDFIPNPTPKSEDQEDVRNGTRLKKPVQVEQICLDVKPSSGGGHNFEATLRIDVPSNIRKEDHLRFCATRRPTNKPKQRPVVFDAIVKSLNRGKMEFEIMQAIPEEIHDANWNVYICGSTMNLSAEFAALEKLIDRKWEATSSFGDIVGLGGNVYAGQNLQEYVNGNECRIPANKFNGSQEEAIRTAVSNPLTLIWGPPGTGKTTVVVEIILQFMRLYPGKRMLVAASTHKAVDNVMERFLKAFGGTDENTEDFIRLTTDPKKVSPGLQKWTLDAFFGVNLADNNKAKRKALQKVQLAKIIFSTCSGAGVGLLRLADMQSHEDGKTKRKDEKFDIVIVDEASQITEPNALVPLVKNSKFVVMVGDHVQLRPVVSEIGKEFELDTSLFEKLYTQSEARKVMLNFQYRMHPDLARFPSNQFYDGKLLSGVRPEDRILPAGRFPWPKAASDTAFYPSVFINCGSEESYGVSKSNKGQAILTKRVVGLLLPEYDEKEIKVLTPYGNQVKCIKQQMESANYKTIEVCTIDGFQGREADIIIFSTVRANCRQTLGFLEDYRRINVAVTRARKGLIVIGHEGTIKDDKFWKELLAACKYVELPLSPEASAGSGGTKEKIRPKVDNERQQRAGKPNSKPKKG